MIAAPSVRIREWRSGSVTVLSLVGTVDDAGAMVQLARQLLAAGIGGGHIVLDLDDLDARNPAALSALLTRLGVATGGVPVPTAVSDPGIRRLLRACGSGAAGLACFGSVEEAADVARPSGIPA